ncbi:MAG: helix-turn-helix domain-containing protein [Gemmatimonadota bacterium]
MSAAERARSHLSADEAEPESLTVDEAAKLFRLDRKTVYAMVEAKQLPGARRFRGAIRIHRPTAVAWWAAGGGTR